MIKIKFLNTLSIKLDDFTLLLGGTTIFEKKFGIEYQHLQHFENGSTIGGRKRDHSSEHFKLATVRRKFSTLKLIRTILLSAWKMVLSKFGKKSI
jgi:hypothetical protein